MPPLNAENLSNLLEWTILFMLVAVIVRPIILWYFKINRRTAYLHKIEENTQIGPLLSEPMKEMEEDEEVLIPAP